MAGIRGKNTKPEIYIRSLLHRHGVRFRVHINSLPSKPDIVLKCYRAIISVHGCFWHARDCHLFKQPSTRPEFWRNKIEGPRKRDAVNIKALKDSGWRVLTVWECSLKGKTRIEEPALAEKVIAWVTGDIPEYEILDGNSGWIDLPPMGIPSGTW